MKPKNFYISNILWDKEDGEVCADIINEQKNWMNCIDILGDFEDMGDVKQSLIDEADRLDYSPAYFRGFVE